MAHTVVVVEDDEDLRLFLRELLVDEGYSVRLTATGAEGLKTIKKIQPDLIILDLGLPDVRGESMCVDIKKNFPHISVIILTGKDKTSDVVRGLNLGADDYLTKPFEGEILLARIKAALRAREKGAIRLTVADLVLDTSTMEVKRGTKPIQLTAQEFKLLEYLMRNKGQVLTRDMILNRIWLSSPDIETRVVDVYVGYLRKKIDMGYKKKLIQSVRGFGYVMKD